MLYILVYKSSSRHCMINGNGREKILSIWWAKISVLWRRIQIFSCIYSCAAVGFFRVVWRIMFLPFSTADCKSTLQAFPSYLSNKIFARKENKLKKKKWIEITHFTQEIINWAKNTCLPCWNSGSWAFRGIQSCLLRPISLFDKWTNHHTWKITNLGQTVQVWTSETYSHLLIIPPTPIHWNNEIPIMLKSN